MSDTSRRLTRMLLVASAVAHLCASKLAWASPPSTPSLERQSALRYCARDFITKLPDNLETYKPAERTDYYLVLISQFYNAQNPHETDNAIPDHLKTLFLDSQERHRQASKPLAVDARTIECTIRNHDEARFILESTEAALIVWGRFALPAPSGNASTSVNIGSLSAGNNAKIAIGTIGSLQSAGTTTITPHATINARYTGSQDGLGLNGASLSTNSIGTVDLPTLEAARPWKLMNILYGVYYRETEDFESAAREFDNSLLGLEDVSGVSELWLQSARMHRRAGHARRALERARQSLQRAGANRLRGLAELVEICAFEPKLRCMKAEYATELHRILGKFPINEDPLTTLTTLGYHAQYILSISQALSRTEYHGEAERIADYLGTYADLHGPACVKLTAIKCGIIDTDGTVRDCGNLLSRVCSVTHLVITVSTLLSNRFVTEAALLRGDLRAASRILQSERLDALSAEFKYDFAAHRTVLAEIYSALGMPRHSNLAIREARLLLRQVSQIDKEKARSHVAYFMPLVNYATAIYISGMRQLLRFPVDISLLSNRALQADGANIGRGDNRLLGGLWMTFGFRPGCCDNVVALRFGLDFWNLRGTADQLFDARMIHTGLVLRREWYLHNGFDARTEFVGGYAHLRTDAANANQTATSVHRPLLGLGIDISTTIHGSTRVFVGIHSTVVPRTSVLLQLPVGLTF